MALEVMTTEGTWVAYTAASTVLPNTDVLRFRDTALAITGSSPNGVGRSALISLPWSARFMICTATTENTTGTQTAGSLTLEWVPKSAAITNTGAEPNPAGATAAGIDAAVVTNGTSDTNGFGIFTVVPIDFKIRAFGLTFSVADLTLLGIHVEVHRY